VLLLGGELRAVRIVAEVGGISSESGHRSDAFDRQSAQRKQQDREAGDSHLEKSFVRAAKPRRIESSSRGFSKPFSVTAQFKRVQSQDSAGQETVDLGVDCKQRRLARLVKMVTDRPETFVCDFCGMWSSEHERRLRIHGSKCALNPVRQATSGRVGCGTAKDPQLRLAAFTQRREQEHYDRAAVPCACFTLTTNEQQPSSAMSRPG